MERSLARFGAAPFTGHSVPGGTVRDYPEARFQISSTEVISSIVYTDRAE
ncbi:MAG: hypothetical protein GY806_21390 [Gammaproteobacteria bacterium]|nr:hypothetical protein [Gammaproteobacteria bacterium]